MPTKTIFLKFFACYKSQTSRLFIFLLGDRRIQSQIWIHTLTNGSGSGSRRPKNMWIRWIRIRIRNNFICHLLGLGSVIHFTACSSVSSSQFLKLFFLASWRSMMKIEGSGSISQMHGSADPDPQQNVMDPQHWLLHHSRHLGTFWSAVPTASFQYHNSHFHLTKSD